MSSPTPLYLHTASLLFVCQSFVLLLWSLVPCTFFPPSFYISCTLCHFFRFRSQRNKPLYVDALSPVNTTHGRTHKHTPNTLRPSCPTLFCWHSDARGSRTPKPQWSHRKRVNMPTHVDLLRVLSDRSPVAADGVIGQRQGCETNSVWMRLPGDILSINTRF